MILRSALYADLPPPARARAWLAALARRDEAELARLVTRDPAGRRAVLALGQALDGVNVATLSAAAALWRAAAQWMAHEAWVAGYAAAGGDVAAPEYLEQAQAADAALAALRARSSEHAAALQAVQEWATREDVDLADVWAALAESEPQGFGEQAPDAETLETVRKLFEPLRLSGVG